MTKTIEIVVGTTGEIRVEAVEFQGPDCEKATRFIEEALGQVQERQKKPEFHTATRRTRQQKVGS